MNKKIILFAAATMALASCSQEEEIIQGNAGGPKTIEITAGMPEGDSRTEFKNGGIKWQENDALNVFVGGNAGSKFTINDADAENETGPGYNMATFTGSPAEGTTTYANNVAYYPYTDGVTLAFADGAYTLKATFPAEQQYAEAGSFGPNSLPMVAVTETTATTDKFQFKPLGGWLQLYVKGDATITKVVMKAKGHKIAGDYTVSASVDANPVITMGENAIDSVIVKCEEPLQLTDDATLFTFAVPSFTFAADEVSFDIHDNRGGVMVNAYKIDKGGTILANAYYTVSKGSAIEYVPNHFIEGFLPDGIVLNEAGEYEVSKVDGLRFVAEEVNKVDQYAANLFSGKTIKLMNNIDLGGEEWTPIGDFKFSATQFMGTFDGQGYTISNFKITKNTSKDDSKKSSYGFFGNVNGTIKNLTIEDATVSAYAYTGALVGRFNGGLIENCHVKNSTVNNSYWQGGILIGQQNGTTTVKGCTVEGSSVTSSSAVAGIVGLYTGESKTDKPAAIVKYIDCTVKDCEIIQNGSFGASYDELFGAFVCDIEAYEGSAYFNNCKVENTKVKGELNSELFTSWSSGTIYIDDKKLEIISDGLWKLDGKEWLVRNAAGLVSLTTQTIKGGESVSLGADIDLTGVEFGGLNVQNWSSRNNINGHGYTVSNWIYEGGASDMGFVRNWIGTVENINFKNCTLKTSGRSAIAAAKIYGDIKNIHIEDCSITDSYWACGLIAGLYNAGSIDGCTVKNSYVESNGGTAAIVGVINEEGGTRKISNCKVEGTTVNNTGVYGESYSGALFAGIFNAGSSAKYVFEKNTFSGNTVQGAHIENALFYSKKASGEDITVDGMKFIADGVMQNAEGEYEISKAAGMQWFANEVNVNKNAFSGKTVKLTADIDLAGIDWEPIGQTGATTFNGIFDGQDYTISNLNVDSEDQTGAHYSSGLFGWVESHSENHGHLKNVKISVATIKGHHNCGALVGYITQQTALVENCHVTSATVSCTNANSEANGDKAGALIGNATVATPVKNCSAANSTVSAGRDAGQVIGAGKEANVTGCSATNVTVTDNETGTGKNIRNEVIGRLL